MREANRASTPLAVVAHADRLAVETMRAIHNRGQQPFFAIFEVTAKRIATQIGNLHEPSKLAVDEKWCLSDPLNFRPQRPLSVKVGHQLSMFLRHRLIIVMDENAVCMGRAISDEKLLKPRDDLLKRLF